MMISSNRGPKEGSQALIAQRGDFILSEDAIPNVPCIILTSDTAKERDWPILVRSELDSYLIFLN